MNKRIVRRKIPEKVNLSDKYHPLLQHIYATRGVQSDQELNYELKNLLPYHDLKNISHAVKRIVQAIFQQEKVLIIGDYDADGATSTVLAIKALQAFGAHNVDYLVPDRFHFGYGLSPAIVTVAKEKSPALIITVDNGMSSTEGVLLANKLNIDVIITDHHLAPQTLPKAFAIVNPNQPDDTFKSKHLAGVGVIFYTLLAVRAFLKDQHYFEKQKIAEPNMAHFLDLVALGTVADVVKLDYNNRILVHQGLRRIRSGRCSPGITALLKLAKRTPKKIVSADLAFAVGPRLNAAGRLQDMSLGVACLLAENPRATQLAEELDTLNHERRELEHEMKIQAFEAVNKFNLDQNLPTALCLYDENWHQGIVGLVASRVKDKIHRPVIAFSKTDESTLKGSARSIRGLHIRDLLDAIASKHPNIITKFGGHAMAAGLSIKLDQLKKFSSIFNKYAIDILKKEGLEDFLETDGELTPTDFSIEIAELLQNAAPWGQGFPEPVFDGEFKIANQYIVGDRHLKLMLQIPKTDCFLHGIQFHTDLKKWPNQRCTFVKIVYKLNSHEYMDQKRLQLLIQDIQPCS